MKPEAPDRQLTPPVDDLYLAGGVVAGGDTPPVAKSNRYDFYVPGEAILEGDFFIATL